MKAVFCLLVAGAVAMAPPRIELDLSTMAVKNSQNKLNANIQKSVLAGHMNVQDKVIHDFEGGQDKSLMKTHVYNEKGEIIGKKHIGSRQDWSQTCPAGSATTQNCPFPVAKAYDHNDEAVTVYTNCYLIDLDGQDTYGQESLPAKIDPADILENTKSDLYGKRATYLFKYDATDKAGNRAEQVVFALILDDRTKPTITSCYGAGVDQIKVEAATQVKISKNGNAQYKYEFFCNPSANLATPKANPAGGSTFSDVAGTKPVAKSEQYTAFDLIDKTLTDIKFNVYNVDAMHSGNIEGEDADATALSQAQASALLSTKLTKKGTARSIVEAVVYDNAKYYGEGGNNNMATDELDVTVEDTTGPLLVLNGPTTAYGECCSTEASNAGRCGLDKVAHAGYTDDLAYANDANDGSMDWTDLKYSGSWAIGSKTYKSDGQKDGDRLTVDLSAVATKEIYFAVQDKNDNWAVSSSNADENFVMRTVEVVDRNVPYIKDANVVDETVIQSNAANVAKADDLLKYGGADSVDPGITYWDSCKAKTDLTVDVQWDDGKGPGDFRDEGTWVRTYKVCDRAGSDETTCDGSEWNPAKVAGHSKCCAEKAANGNTLKAIPCCTSKSHKFTVVDAQVPTIKVEGEKFPDPIEASVSEEYTDSGATCEDYVDGVLSHAVEVSGEVVNMRVPGKYTIRYDCIDLSGLEAVPEFRVVTIQDSTGPTVTILESEVYVEAGFPYEDQGFTATDSLDGKIDNLGMWNIVYHTDKNGKSTGVVDYQNSKAGCMTDGNTVNTAQAFYTQRSCKGIKATCGAACETGEYTITTYNDATSQNQPVKVWCNMESGKTYVTMESAVVKATPGVAGEAQNDCTTELGNAWDVAQFTSEKEKSIAFDRFCASTNADECAYVPTTPVPSNQYLCSLNDEDTASAGDSAKPAVQEGGAEVGEYDIVFKCKDRSGNKDQQWAAGTPVTRKVTVKDTLPPVITLHLRQKMIAQGAGNQKGINGRTNPAGQKGKNPNLMAEETTSSVNGWIVGALASAISGLALLGYSLRKSNDVVTSVPV